MGKKSKSPNSPAKAGAQSPQERHFEWWKLLLGIGAVLLAALIGILPQIVNKSSPQFALVKPITRPDSGIVIIAQNGAADHNKPLDFELDGYAFPAVGKPIPKSDPQRWRVAVLELDLPDSLVRDGSHRVRVRFAGDEFSENLTLGFSTQAPVVQVEITQPAGKPQDRAFSGKVASKLQAAAETLSVDIAFHHEGKPVEISLPVKRVTDQTTGVTYFEFATEVSGLPKIPAEDPRYAEPFFAIRVTDQAGNSYFQEESYAQFMAPGDKRFGVNSINDILVQRLPVDLQPSTKVAFRLMPKAQPRTQLLNGEPALVLKVKSLATNINHLQWDSNLPLDQLPNLTLIYRDDQHLTVAFGNEYTDEHAPANARTSYRVEQQSPDGQVYRSNTATPEPQPELSLKDSLSQLRATEPAMRDKASELATRLAPIEPLTQSSVYTSVDAVKQMLIASNYFDANYNPSGGGLQHQYEKLNRNGANLVFDRASGLTWQQSGLDKYVNFGDAQAYVARLNQDKFGGYDNWRLPTLMEAMALMEREKRSELYIDEVFGRRQLWIWTADQFASGRAWVVAFYDGGCIDLYLDSNYINVRAVRSGQ